MQQNVSTNEETGIYFNYDSRWILCVFGCLYNVHIMYRERRSTSQSARAQQLLSLHEESS